MGAGEGANVMLLRTNKTNKKGEKIYVNKFTGKKQTIPVFAYSRTKKTIPEYAYFYMGIIEGK